jgi:hypothetical protein
MQTPTGIKFSNGMNTSIVHQRLRPRAVQDIGDRNSNKNDHQQRHYDSHYAIQGVLRYTVQIARRNFAFTPPYDQTDADLQ